MSPAGGSTAQTATPAARRGLEAGRMAAARRVQKKTAYHHGDLRRALINAALRLVEEQGASAVTLREVARMAGVSHQAPYRHFADRSALLAAVAEEGLRELHTELVEASRNAPDVLGALRACGVTYVVFAVAHPAHFRVMHSAEASSSDDPGLIAASDAVFTLLTRAVAEARTGEASEPDTLAYALAAWSIVHGLASLLVEGALTRRPYANKSPRELANMALDTLREGFVGRTRR
jgi:AcrR family transcriptional regulator